MGQIRTGLETLAWNSSTVEKYRFQSAKVEEMEALRKLFGERPAPLAETQNGGGGWIRPDWLKTRLLDFSSLD
jgi:hypothetical protein